MTHDESKIRLLTLFSILAGYFSLYDMHFKLYHCTTLVLHGILFVALNLEPLKINCSLMNMITVVPTINPKHILLVNNFNINVSMLSTNHILPLIK